MDEKELFKKVRKIQIVTSRAVNEIMAGEYNSVFKGRGMEFDEVREYMPGDDVRAIDWNVTARSGRPHVKRYCEERELTILFLVDVSLSNAFGSTDKTKAELAAEVAAVLAFSAIRNNDKVGLILFSDRIEKFIPPRKGKKPVLRLIREMIDPEPRGNGTDIALALEYLQRVQRKRAVVFLISDFIAQDFSRQLRMARRRHDIVAVSVADPREAALPDVGLIEVEDAETGEVLMLDTSSATVRALFTSCSDAAVEHRRRTFRKSKVDEMIVNTSVPFMDAIHRLFRERARRMRH